MMMYSLLVIFYSLSALHSCNSDGWNVPLSICLLVSHALYFIKTK